MATSPNFSWPEPDNTDLVKNGALAIRTAINAIDTSMVDLKGGTTGQVLSKASATDMDFSWVTDATGIPATIFDAKGDIIAATAADTAGRLAVGTNGQTLVADSSTATGLKWATAGGGSKVVQIVTATTSTTVSNTTGTKVDTGLTATITPTSASNKVLVFVDQQGCGKGGSDTALELYLLRGATIIMNIAQIAAYTASTATNIIGACSAVYLDSPATTSATTYKTQLASYASSASAVVQYGTDVSSICLMEVTP